LQVQEDLIDLTDKAVQELVLKLPVQEFKQVIKSDDLKCHSEDHVLDVALAYIVREQ